MPYSVAQDLTSKHPLDTYNMIVTTDGGQLFDGTGSLIESLTVTSFTSSHVTESYATEPYISSSWISSSFITASNVLFVSASINYLGITTISCSGVTSSLFGTSSWAVSASWAPGLETGSSYPFTSSWASWVSASGVVGGLTQDIYFVSESFTTMSFANGVLISVI